MGQKSSKKADLYVTEDNSHCSLPEKELKDYDGRAREYTAVGVFVEEHEWCKDNDDSKEQPTSPHSIIAVLNKAHTRGYQLSFVVPRVSGSKPSKLERNSLIAEEPNSSDGKEDEGEGCADVKITHTLFLLRPKVKSRIQKEISLKQMEAKKTILNMMINVEKRWGFSVKNFTENRSALSSGKLVEKLQEIITAEAVKGGKLLSVMSVEDESRVSTTAAANGNGNGSANKSEEKEANGTRESAANQLSLRMVFLYNVELKPKQIFRYDVACHNSNCTEQILKTKKNQAQPKSDRKTNVTWSENWLKLFKEDARLVEVVNIGELSSSSQNQGSDAQDAKAKKPKPSRQFQVSTLCFYEKPLDDDDAKPPTFDSLAREVWAPLNDNVLENLEREAESYGASGWELCTVLVTSHVRMKTDGSEHRKCVVFFQRPKKGFVPPSELDKSRENLAEDSAETKEETPTSPKDKQPRFGVAIMNVDDLGKSRLKSSSKPPPSPVKKAEEALPAVKLKKVDRDQLKKEEGAKDVNLNPQVKLKPTGTKSPAESKEDDKEVPWMASLERKRKAVLESEEKTQQRKSVQQPEVEEEAPTSVAELTKKVEAKSDAVADASIASAAESKAVPDPEPVSDQVPSPEKVEAKEEAEIPIEGDSPVKEQESEETGPSEDVASEPPHPKDLSPPPPTDVMPEAAADVSVPESSTDLLEQEKSEESKEDSSPPQDVESPSPPVDTDEANSKISDEGHQEENNDLSPPEATNDEVTAAQESPAKEAEEDALEASKDEKEQPQATEDQDQMVAGSNLASPEPEVTESTDSTSPVEDNKMDDVPDSPAKESTGDVDGGLGEDTKNDNVSVKSDKDVPTQAEPDEEVNQELHPEDESPLDADATNQKEEVSAPSNEDESELPNKEEVEGSKALDQEAEEATEEQEEAETGSAKDKDDDVKMQSEDSSSPEKQNESETPISEVASSNVKEEPHEEGS